MKLTLRQALFAASAALVFSGASLPSALAQQAEQTGIASPGRVEGQFAPQGMVPRHIPKIEVREMKEQGVPPGAEGISFFLSGIRLDGVTAYPQGELEAVYKDRIGATVTLADLYGIASALTRKYRNDGYILTQVVVPPQTIDGGTPRLQVVEGYVASIRVQSAESDAETQMVKDYLSFIDTSGKEPLNVRGLERALLLTNDLPGMQARSVLSPSRSRPGGADLLVIVDRKEYDGMVGLDNFGTKFLGPIQLSGAGSLNSVLGYNERITAQVVTAPNIGGDFNRELDYVSLGYRQPVSRYGTTFELRHSRTYTDPGFRLREFDVKGKSNDIAATLYQPFVRTRALNLTGRATFDYRNVDTKNNIAGDPTRRDRVRSLRIGGRLEYLENLLGVAYDVVDVEVSRGLHVLGASNNNGADQLSRPFADPTPYKLNVELQRLQHITDNVNLLLGLQGQIASDALLSSEEFGVGGMNYGRGYDSSEIIGDDGIAGKVELQWNRPVDVATLQDYQLYGFFDAGHVWDGDSAAAVDRVNSLTSTGFGIRADFTEMTKAGLMVAVPLSRTPQTQNNEHPRIYLNINREF